MTAEARESLLNREARRLLNSSERIEKRHKFATGDSAGMDQRVCETSGAYPKGPCLQKEAPPHTAGDYFLARESLVGNSNETP